MTFKEEFHSFVSMLVLFHRKHVVEWEAVIGRTAKMIVLLIKCPESHATRAGCSESSCTLCDDWSVPGASKCRELML